MKLTIKSAGSPKDCYVYTPRGSGGIMLFIGSDATPELVSSVVTTKLCAYDFTEIAFEVCPPKCSFSIADYLLARLRGNQWL